MQMSSSLAGIRKIGGDFTYEEQSFLKDFEFVCNNHKLIVVFAIICKVLAAKSHH
jgi:hypothetical protein